ncbi:MAG: radical SAM protein, partial [Rhodobacteraceae bacterium]|nr:radical SAM protein [Paracoccaceae bacterium]
MYIGRELYDVIADPATQRTIFRKSINRVEVETHSYCNRRCDYCPNVTGDRLGPNLLMADAVWQAILRDLAEVGYAGVFVLNSYNEPLYDRALILARLAELRAVLPGARTMIYTNGDYLVPGYAEDLAAAGLDYLHVSIHLKRGDVFSDAYVRARIEEISARAAIPVRYVTARPGELLVARFQTGALEMESRAINFDVHGNDRGGLLPQLSPQAVRTAPCTFVFQHLHVGYNGNVMPCCHLRSDRPEHAAHVIGNIAGAGSIFSIFG